MSRDASNADRWREGISERRAERIERLYLEALDRLEAAGARSAPLLRHAHRREHDRDLPPLVYVYDRELP
jgi:hypothetical protein